MDNKNKEEQYALVMATVMATSTWILVAFSGDFIKGTPLTTDNWFMALISLLALITTLYSLIILIKLKKKKKQKKGCKSLR